MGQGRGSGGEVSDGAREGGSDGGREGEGSGGEMSDGCREGEER